MAKWDSVTTTEKSGGWGIKNLDIFGKAFQMKSLWRGMWGNTLWSQALKVKYFKSDVVEWIKKPMKNYWNSSVIWKGFMQVFHWIRSELSWQIGNGQKIQVGVDRILGLHEDFKLSDEILDFLRNRNFTTLDRMRNYVTFQNDSYWIKGADLGLLDCYESEWDLYFSRLNYCGCRLTSQSDVLKWEGNPISGEVTAKSAYNYTISIRNFSPQHWWFKKLWRWKIPTKLKCFGWFAFKEKLKTWDNLARMGWIGPNRCPLYKSEAESTNHILVHCRYTRDIWEQVCNVLDIHLHWGWTSFEVAFLNWFRECRSHPVLPLFISWVVWYSKNKSVFEDMIPLVTNGVKQILSLYKSSFKGKKPSVVKKIGAFEPNFNYPVLFFDGAAQGGFCAIGGTIFLNGSHHFTLKMNCGLGSNMKVELIALWCVLKVSKIFGIDDLKVYGDSRVTIKWEQGVCDLNVLALVHWCHRIRSEIQGFRKITFQHIYRQHNALADKLSKLALLGDIGVLVWEEFLNSQIQNSGKLDFFE